MKNILLPFGSSFYIIFQILWITFLILGLLLIPGGVKNSNTGLFILGSIFIILSFSLFLLNAKTFIIPGKVLPNMILIKDITPISFTYETHKSKFFAISDDDFEKLYTTKQTTINWTEIQKVIINNMFDQIEIFSSLLNFKISKDVVNFYSFLKQLPKYSDKVEEGKIHDFFNSLTNCNICGLKAVNNLTCLHCQNKTFDKTNTYYTDEIFFIKNKQLEYFEVYPEDIDIVLERKKDTGFDFSEDWELYVTRDEILEYSNKPE